jgi:hypothetical protein
MKPRKYDFTGKLRKGPVRTKQEIIDSLKQFAREKESQNFTRKEYDAWKHRALCASQIAHRFGSWAIAMERAGLEARWQPVKGLEEMVELFMDCWEEHDDAPTVKALGAYLKRIGSKFTVHMYTHHFGGLRRLAQRVADFQDGKISEAQLVERYVPEGRPRRPISPKLRLAVMERDSFCCRLCGHSAKAHGVALEVDHIVPVALGGTNELDNLQTLCENCNAGKRDSLVSMEGKN